MVPYVYAVVGVTVMCILLFVLHVCMLCEDDGNAGVGDGCGCGECRVCGWYTLFRYCIKRSGRAMWMRGVGGVCEMCLVRGGVGGEWIGF